MAKGFASQPDRLKAIERKDESSQCYLSYGVGLSSFKTISGELEGEVDAPEHTC